MKFLSRKCSGGDFCRGNCCLGNIVEEIAFEKISVEEIPIKEIAVEEIVVEKIVENGVNAAVGAAHPLGDRIDVDHQQISRMSFSKLPFGDHFA